MGTAAGWQLMADAQPLEPLAQDEDEEFEVDEEEAEGTANKKYEYATRQPDPVLDRVTKYNVFCPTCVPVEDEAEEGNDAAIEPRLGETDYPDATRTQLPLALVATMEAKDPGISIATISHTDGSTGVFAEGEQVLDGVTLLSVHLGIVYLQTASRVEYLQLSSGDPPPKPAAPKPEPDKAASTKSTNPNEIAGAADAIKCNGNSCTVERKFINQLLANPAQLAGQVAVAHYDKQGLQGFQLRRVRKGTIPRMLGFRNSDVIRSINGHELKSVDQAMKLYQQLRSSSHLSIDYVHGYRGKRYEKRLEIDII